MKIIAMIWKGTETVESFSWPSLSKRGTLGYAVAVAMKSISFDFFLHFAVSFWWGCLVVAISGFYDRQELLRQCYPKRVFGRLAIAISRSFTYGRAVKRNIRFFFIYSSGDQKRMRPKTPIDVVNRTFPALPQIFTNCRKNYPQYDTGCLFWYLRFRDLCVR